MAQENKNPDMETETGATPEAEAATATQEKPKKGKGKSSDLEAKLAGAEQKLADAEATTEEVRQALMRTAAEYENHRKRSQKEFETAFGNGVSHAAESMLPILDTLEAAAAAETADEEYKKGVLMILNKAHEVFKKLGIEEIDCDGKPFDPELHNAVMQEAVEDKEAGTVTRVLQKGYVLNGRVVRHACVAVTP